MTVVQLTTEAYVLLAMIIAGALMYFLGSGKLMKSNPSGRLVTLCSVIAIVSIYEYQASLAQHLPIPPFDPQPAQSLAAVYAIFTLGLLIFIAEYQRNSSLLIQRYRNLLWERTHVLELSSVVIGIMLSVTLTNGLLLFGAFLGLFVGFSIINSLYSIAYFEQTEKNYYLYICSQTSIILREIEKSKNKDKQQIGINRFIAQLRKLELEYNEAFKNSFHDSIDGYINILRMQIVKILHSKNAPKGVLCIPIVKFLYQIQVKQDHAKKYPENCAILKRINETVLELIAFWIKTEETELMQELLSVEFKNYLEKLIEDDESKTLENTEQSMRQDGLSLVENVQRMLKKTQDEPTIRLLSQVKGKLSSGKLEES